MSVEVLQPGTFSLLVDAGRPGTRHLGVPLGGAADVAAYSIGNALAGNDAGAVALEMTLSGPNLRADHDISACIFGAPFQFHVDGQPISTGCLFHWRAGETLRVGGAERGARAYICVSGGFQVKPILGGRTAFAPLAVGDKLECNVSSTAGRSLAHTDAATALGISFDPGVFRIVEGPQANWFDLSTFLRHSYAVSTESNRMGVRLTGERLVRPERELTSEAVTPGAIQITNEGLPIILGVDGQTIGGYPKIAHIIRADLDRLGQLRPGDLIRFERVSHEQAEQLAIDRRRRLLRWTAALRLMAN
jgi:antagonist of KipI